APGAAPGSLGPWEGRPIRLGRVRRGQREDGRLPRGITEVADPFDRARKGKLRRAETVDEVTPPNLARLLERTQYRVHAGEPARRAFGQDRLAREHAVTFEELHRSRVRGLRRRGLRLEQGPHERPPAGGRGRPGAPEGSRPGLGAGAGGLRRAGDQEGPPRRDGG